MRKRCLEAGGMNYLLSSKVGHFNLQSSGQISVHYFIVSATRELCPNLGI